MRQRDAVALIFFGMVRLRRRDYAPLCGCPGGLTAGVKKPHRAGFN